MNIVETVPVPVNREDILGIEQFGTSTILAAKSGVWILKHNSTKWEEVEFIEECIDVSCPLAFKVAMNDEL